MEEQVVDQLLGRRCTLETCPPTSAKMRPSLVLIQSQNNHKTIDMCSTALLTNYYHVHPCTVSCLHVAKRTTHYSMTSPWTYLRSLRRYFSKFLRLMGKDLSRFVLNTADSCRFKPFVSPCLRAVEDIHIMTGRRQEKGVKTASRL